MDKEEARNLILKLQKDEVTEYALYDLLYRNCSGKNAQVILKIRDMEKMHYKSLKKITGRDVKPDWIKILWYSFLINFFGVTFVIKLLEGDERRVQREYERVEEVFPQVWKIKEDEVKHEKELIEMIREEDLKIRERFYQGLMRFIYGITGIFSAVILLPLTFEEKALIVLIISTFSVLSAFLGSDEPLSSSFRAFIYFLFSLLPSLILIFIMKFNLLISLIFLPIVFSVLSLIINYFLSYVENEDFAKISFSSLFKLFVSWIIGSAFGFLLKA